MKKLAPLIIAPFLLIGCAEAVPAGGETFNSIEDLRDSYVDAGGDCPSWNQTNAVEAALQSGTCNDQTVLSLFGSKDEANASALLVKQLTVDFGLEPALVVGENWVINANDADEAVDIQKKMGGLLIK